MEEVFKYIIGLGAAVMMPIIFTILGVCIGIKLPKALKSGLLVGVGLLLTTLGLSVYDIQTKPALDTYFMGMQALPLVMYAWVTYYASKQLRRFKAA